MVLALVFCVPGRAVAMLPKGWNSQESPDLAGKAEETTRVFLALPVMQDRLFIAKATLLSLFYCADGVVTVLTNGN